MLPPRGNVESYLLLRIAGGKLPPLPEAARSDRPVAVDWERLLALATLDNSVPVVRQALATLPSRTIPSSVASQFERLAVVWEFRLSMLQQRVVETLRLLGDAGFEPLLLKGAALAVTAYGGFAGRPMADVDLLLEASCAREAHELLQRCGWRWNDREYPGHAYEEHHHLMPLTDAKGSRLELELHTAPLAPGHPFQLTAEDLLASARTVTFAGVRVRVPEPHLHVVHAMIHFAWSHRFENGSWSTIRDLATLLDRGLVTWPGLVDAARRARAETCCYWTLRLARRLAGVSVPDDVLESLRPAMRPAVLRRLEAHFVHLVLRDDRACPSVGVRGHLWWLAMQPVPGRRPVEHVWLRMPRTDVGAPGRVLGALQRVSRHAMNASRWTRYVATLMFPRYSA